jgi:hypothetical protein
MSQSELLKFFYYKYLEHKEVYYSVADLRKYFSEGDSALGRKLTRLWLNGALVCKTYERMKKGIGVFNWGRYYRLNERCINTVKLMIEIEQSLIKKSDDSIQRNTYIPNIVLEEEKKSHKGGI